MSNLTSAEASTLKYLERLQETIKSTNISLVAKLANEMMRCWREQRNVFICGNGGSAGNAIHLANDFLYGIAKKTGGGLRIHALSANPAVMTCLANDIGYDFIYSEQIAVLAKPEDLLIVLTGSGSSRNVVNAVDQAKKMGLVTCSILGFDGGLCKNISDIPIHFAVNDMQIAEDMQLIVGHMVMQWMFSNRDLI
jgi:D-sedoheptulose 7-phosphate isomerase